MKRMLSIILVLIMLLVPVTGVTADGSEEQEVKKVIKEYFDFKYKILSNLTYDGEIAGFISPEVLSTKDAVNEADVLETIVKYRKAQINDLGFEKYKYDLLYSSFKIEGDKAWAVFGENYELYHKCAPTVKNSSSVEHVILLKKQAGTWFIMNDDYADPDGIKKKLNKYFIEDNVSAEEAKAKVLKESENQANLRYKKLENLLKNQNDKNIAVLHAGKSIAYLGGTAARMDKEKSIAPVLYNKTVMLPLMYIFEKTGSLPGWQDKTGIKVVTGKGPEIKLKIDSKTAYVNNKKLTLKLPVKMINGTAMISAEGFAQITGKKLFYDEKGLVILTDSSLDKRKNAKLIEKLKEFYSVLFTKTDFPRIDGSTATYPFSIEMGKELLGLDDIGAKGFLTHNTTHDAYVNLIDKKTDIVFVTQPSQEEYKLAKAKGIELEVIPMCREGFVFLVNKDNPVNNLTSKQVKDIYQGKTKNWKGVGGESNDIIPYQRNANSGSQTLMESVVMKGLKLVEPPTETLIFGMGELIDRVADYSNARNALGYSVYYYATSMYANRNVKLISIDGVAPNKQTIKNQTYPFTVGYYAVLRKSEPKDSNARKLLNWILGEEGQSIVDKAGFVSIK